MQYFLFVYNIFLIVLYTIASTAFLISYIRRQSSVDGWIALLFALFVVDNSMIYMTEVIMNASEAFPLTIKSLILCSFLLCYGQIFKNICHSQFTKTDYFCYIVYVIVSFATPMASGNRFVAWLSLSYVWIMLVYVLSRAYYASKKLTAALMENECLKIKLIYITGVAFIVAAILENWVKSFSGQDIPFLGKNAYTRNISEDLYSVYIVVLALWYLSAKMFEPVSAIKQSDTVAVNPPEYGDKLEVFAKKYKITPREAEVLNLLIIGYTNQQISEALFISLGTVKNHAHNIYQKCEVTRREQLLRLINGLV